MKVIRKGKTVGEYNPKSNVFVKRVIESKHKMKLMDGYGIEQDVYEELVSKASRVVIFTDTKNRLGSLIQSWIDHGVTRDFGHGNQRFLSEKYMTS